MKQCIRAGRPPPITSISHTGEYHCPAPGPAPSRPLNKLTISRLVATFVGLIWHSKENLPANTWPHISLPVVNLPFPYFVVQTSYFWWDRKNRVLPLQCNYDGSDCIYCDLIRLRSLYWIPAREVIYWNINKYNRRGSESGELIKIYKTPAGPRLQWIQQR